MALKVALAVAILLCMRIAAISGQQISPSPTIEGQVGQTVLIMCTSAGAGSSSNILQVYRPSSNSFGTVSERVDISNDLQGPNTNYTFGPLVADDNGTIFRCSSLSLTSGNSSINVIFPPTIVRDDPMGESGEVITRLEDGGSFSVGFTVMGNPPPTSTWTVNGGPISDSSITLTPASIVFNPLSRRQKGNYTLTVMNRAGRDTHSFYLSVTYIPEFSAETQQNFNCSDDTPIPMPIPCASYAGMNGEFICNAAGNPTPTVNATTEGVENTDNVDLTAGTSISIISVVNENAGDYICNATSGVGFATRRFRFYVGGTPRGVSNVSNISVGPENVQITVAYDNSVNPVPATTMHAEVFRSDNMQVIVWQDSMSINSTIYYTFTVPADVVRGVITQNYTARARVENLQGNSSAVDGFFTSFVSKSIVLAGSPLVCLLFLAVGMLFY